MKSIVDDLVVIFDWIEDTTNTAAINPSNANIFHLIATVLSAIVCLLLLVTIVVQYHMKSGSAIAYLLSYYYRDELFEKNWYEELYVQLFQ